MTIAPSSAPSGKPLYERNHPLELIPLFRRWPPSLARNLFYTAIWSSLLALALVVLQILFGRNLPFLRLLGATLVISNLIGFMVHGALHLIERTLPRENIRLFRAAQVLAITAASVIGIPFGNALVVGHMPLRFYQYSGTLVFLLLFGLMTAGLMVMVLAAGERRMRREAESARQQEQIAAAGRLVAEARLRALQAQIEPHFLYNTLANVVSLIDSQPAKARRMLERFIDYLRASLAASRAEHASVGGELDLASAYLDVLGVRLEGRLRWRFELAPALSALPLPPMLLQPLVENAIMHGIEPKLDGGEIVVRARVDDGMLCIEVADTGLGLRTGADAAAARPGGGVGLSNLRERLRQLYGGAARMQLIENPAGGVTSRLLLPLQVPSSTVPTP
ncbi:sensor histidine kinase [Massilia sp. MS-15]|uniref:sensor histidine kinase n=1 Tax=Massilia sp. MS-15 TaxID=2878200 RepID=UPI001CD62897|nr:histidine kinase [Massilia sp. MS-15]MCA1247829.1 histidine kinase [Massilia sp. MS-15]